MNITMNKPGIDYTDIQLRDIAGLIYDTDSYIYPAMFSSKDEAVSIIPAMFKSNDDMFNVNNLFSASQDERVVGIILWHRGPMKWNNALYKSNGGNSPYIYDLMANYFSEYSMTPENTVSIINVCTSVHGKGIGGMMLNAFFKDIYGPYELFVLADNMVALKLYQKNGFVIAEEGQGYSIDKRILPCYKMVRR